MTRFFLFLSFFLSFLISFGQMPPAGTEISNVAVVVYEDSRGVKYRDESNPVLVKVKAVYGVDITPDFQEITSFPGKIIDIPYSITNKGNTEDSYLLEVKNETNDDGDLLNPQIYIDENKDGKVNPGEPFYDNSNPPTLTMGETLSIVIQGQVPASISSGNINVSVKATSKRDPTKVDDNNLTVITITPSGSLEIKKSSNKTSVNPGETISFLIEFQNPADNPVRGTSISTDFDNNNDPESRVGVVIYDIIPEAFTFQSIDNITVNNAIKVYKGERDTYWKDDISEIDGDLKYVGIFIPDNGTGAVEGNARGNFVLVLKAKESALHGNYENKAYAVFKTPLGETKVVSNPVGIEVNLVANIILDDTDDGENNYTGNNSPDDPDDLTVINNAPAGIWIEVKNEIWNLGNAPQVIDISVDTENYPLPQGTIIEFRDLEGRPLLDTNGNDYPDFGILQPGEKREFITRIKLPEGNYENVVVGLKALLFVQNSLEDEDYTFIKLNRALPSQVQIKVKVEAKAEEVLTDTAIIVYEYNSLQDNEPIDYKIFKLDKYGKFPPEFYNYLKDDKVYRIAIAGDYKGLPYILSPYFTREYLFAVNQEGEEKCWDKVGNEVNCDSPRARVKARYENGQSILILPLDPAGYVYDASTGERINGACVSFYRCIDNDCKNYELVNPSLLDYYPDGRTRQENPQVSGPTDVEGNTVGGKSEVKGEGGFQFTFRNFNSSLEGWYFIEVTYDCNFRAADPTLADKYQPVKLNPNGVWTPESGRPYRGEKFYISASYDETSLMAIPLIRAGARKLIVTKKSFSSVSSIGEFVKWEISVKNPNSFIAKNVEVYDILPKGLRYKKGSTYINGRKAPDPSIENDGRTLVWNVGDLEPSADINISFYAIITPGIREGKVKNLAYARGCIDDGCFIKLESNDAFASLTIKKGIFSDKAYIIGKVFMDNNANGIQEKGEIGVQGVKIYLEDGRYVITDKEGKYHFDNVSPGMHIVKLDPESIPKGLKPIPLNNRFANDEDTVFVDLYPGDFFKVDFALIEDKQVQISEKELVSIKRYISDFVKDANTGDVYIKNVVVIKNISNKPIGDAYYEEVSPYEPIIGTVYMNGAPYDNAEPTEKGFGWNLMLIRPQEEIKISWLSYIPIKYFRDSTYTFKGNAIGEGKILVSKNVPLTFTMTERNKYLLKINPGEKVSKELKDSLQAISLYLRENKNFGTLILQINGHVGIKKQIEKLLEAYGIPKNKVGLR